MEAPFYKCNTCEKIFKSYQKATSPKYCSRKCFQIRIKTPETIQKMSLAKIGHTPWNKRNKKEKIKKARKSKPVYVCKQCNKEFYNSNKGRNPQFCSLQCFGISNRKDRKCLICGEHVKWDNKLFCSKKCTTIHQTGIKLSDEHKKSLSIAKKGRPIRHFIDRKEEIAKKISIALKGKPQPWMRGEKHPNYKDGGKAANERQKEMGRVEYKIWRRAVFERDNYTCSICKVRGGILNADHILPWINYPDMRYEIGNGRTLCIKCHRKTPTWGGIRKKRIL